MLVGNGKPGKVNELDSRISCHGERISKLERWIWMVTGGGLAIGFVIEKFLKL
jgi:hypothetical protein